MRLTDLYWLTQDWKFMWTYFCDVSWCQCKVIIFFLFAFTPPQKNQQLPAEVVHCCTVPCDLVKSNHGRKQGYSFPLILRHNLFNWCQSWGPYGESPENTHTDRHAHLLTLKKKKKNLHKCNKILSEWCWNLLIYSGRKMRRRGCYCRPSSHSSLTGSFNLSQSRLTPQTIEPLLSTPAQYQ